MITRRPKRRSDLPSFVAEVEQTFGAAGVEDIIEICQRFGGRLEAFGPRDEMLEAYPPGVVPEQSPPKPAKRENSYARRR